MIVKSINDTEKAIIQIFYLFLIENLSMTIKI